MERQQGRRTGVSGRGHKIELGKQLGEKEDAGRGEKGGDRLSLKC
jgi:hypothetical protein